MKIFLAALGMTLMASACAATPLATPPAALAPVDPVELKGEWKQGSVILGKAVAGTKVEFNGRAVRISPEGLFVIGLDRDEPATAELRITPQGGGAELRKYGVAPRTYDIQRIEGLPEKQVNPPAEALKRIAEDLREVRAARARDTARIDFSRPFIWPALGRISGVYGSQRILNGQPKQPHYGVDVAVPIGTPVRAPASGVVSLAVPDMYFTGGTLMIDHGHGLESTLMHLSKLLVKEGDEVQQGQVVAESGMTGRATGPHVDWRISWFESRVDARLLAGPMPETPAATPAPAPQAK